MKLPYPPLKSMNLIGVIEWLQSIARIREDDLREFRGAKFGGVRLRRDRTTAPIGFADVASGIDQEGDYFFVGGNLYLLVNDAGTLKWAQITANVTY